jgi:hypothetical protein
MLRNEKNKYRKIRIPIRTTTNNVSPTEVTIPLAFTQPSHLFTLGLASEPPSLPPGVTVGSVSHRGVCVAGTMVEGRSTQHLQAQ